MDRYVRARPLRAVVRPFFQRVPVLDLMPITRHAAKLFIPWPMSRMYSCYLAESGGPPAGPTGRRRARWSCFLGTRRGGMATLEHNEL
jgi:hypothetical protein